MRKTNRAARWIAWVLIGLGAIVVAAVFLATISGFDPKSTGSLVFAAFFLLATGWVVGDF